MDHKKVKNVLTKAFIYLQLNVLVFISCISPAGLVFKEGVYFVGNVISPGIIKMYTDLYLSCRTWREIPADLWRR